MTVTEGLKNFTRNLSDWIVLQFIGARQLNHQGKQLHISIAEIAAELGMSKRRVRESLQRLRKRGVISLGGGRTGLHSVISISDPRLLHVLDQFARGQLSHHSLAYCPTVARVTNNVVAGVLYAQLLHQRDGRFAELGLREFAKRLGVSKNTIARAARLLEDFGFISVIPGGGSSATKFFLAVIQDDSDRCQNFNF